MLQLRPGLVVWRRAPDGDCHAHYLYPSRERESSVLLSMMMMEPLHEEVVSMTQQRMVV